MEKPDPESFQETADEMNAITNMLKFSEEQGLQVEVVWSYSSAIMSGDSITVAAQFALNEWDC